MAGNRRQAQQDLLGFPLLSFGELTDCLYALGVSITVDDISKPSPQTTQMIYGQLIDILMGIPLESMDGPRSSLLGMMEHRDLYVDALQFTMFYRHCHHLAMICGIKSFLMMDLVKPDAVRFRSILSGMMNFAKFRESRSHFQSSLQHKVHDQTERLHRLQKEVQAVEDDIEDIKTKAEADKPKTEEAKRKNDEIRDENNKHDRERLDIQAVVDDLKRERSGLQDRTTKKNYDINELQKKLADTRSRLVQSPERIKRGISEMSTNLTHEKSILSNHQRKTRELQNRLDIITNLERDLRDLIELSRGIAERRNKLGEAERTKASTIARLDQKKIDLTSLDAKLAQLDRLIQNAENKLRRQATATEEMRTTAQEKIASLKNEYVTKTKERNVWNKKKDHLAAELADLEAEMAAFTSKHEEGLNALLGEYAKIRNQADDYMDTITDKLGLVGVPTSR